MLKYKIVGDVGDEPVELTPIWNGELKRTKVEGKFYFKVEFTGDFKFVGLDYRRLMNFKDDPCGSFDCTIYYYCQNVLTKYVGFVFNLFDAEINEDLCYITVKPTIVDKYSCLTGNLERTENLFDADANIETVVRGRIGAIEVEVCGRVENSGSCAVYSDWLANPLADCIDSPNNWALKRNDVSFGGNVNNIICESPTGEGNVAVVQSTVWHRQVVTVPCDNGAPLKPSFGSPDTWFPISGVPTCVNGFSTWFRKPLNNVNVGDYHRGRTFIGVIRYIVERFYCDLTVKSDFFGIFPENDAPQNDAYVFASRYLQKMTVHQKSDVKRKGSTSPSTREAWEVSLKDFFEDLRIMFNVYYVIKNGKFIIEHFSYFVNNTTFTDLSNFNQVKKQYSFDANDKVFRETFFWSDEKVSEPFLAFPIEYYCGDLESVRENRCKVFTTDLACIENVDKNAQIKDSGFVLCANVLVNGQLAIYENNLPLTWTELHVNLHRDGRLYSSGVIATFPTDFYSWFPFKRSEPFTFTQCCEDLPFDFDKGVKTVLGIGQTVEAVENLEKSTLTLTLHY